jgi:hypothetical protein
MDVAGFRVQNFRPKAGEKHVRLHYDEVKNASRIIVPQQKCPTNIFPSLKGSARSQVYFRLETCDKNRGFPSSYAKLRKKWRVKRPYDE